MLKVNQDNYFEIAEAIYTFCALNHEGMGSEKYRLSSRLGFEPGPLWKESRVEKENVYFPEIELLSDSELEALVEEVERIVDISGQ